MIILCLYLCPLIMYSLPTTPDPYGFNGNMELISMTDGIRCGPQNVCINQTCVGVASLPIKCRHCPGENIGGCDQHHVCYCDERKYGSTACRTGTYTPINPGKFWFLRMRDCILSLSVTEILTAFERFIGLHEFSKGKVNNFMKSAGPVLVDSSQAQVHLTFVNWAFAHQWSSSSLPCIAIRVYSTTVHLSSSAIPQNSSMISAC